MKGIEIKETDKEIRILSKETKPIILYGELDDKGIRLDECNECGSFTRIKIRIHENGKVKNICEACMIRNNKVIQ